VDIFVTTNLSDHLTNSHWVWLERGPSCSTYQYTNQPESQAFFILGTPTDNDGDGLTDAYELLVSKTLVSTNDTDADGIPDAWEVAHGLNPLWNDASEDPDADGLTNYQEYLANSDPQVGVMVVAWGRNSSGQCNVPAGLRDVVAVAGGEKSSFALKRDGTVVAWGGNALGETNLPIALTNATAIVGNGYASCSTPTGIGLALSNGVVISWGTNLGNPPSGLSGVSALAVGAFHSLALKSNGTVVSWGNTNQWAARVPAGLANVKAITTGWHHSAALLSNGTVTAWGLYAPELGYTLTNVPAGLSDVAAISAYGLHTLALRSNGTVVAWGYNQAGQTNVPSGLSNIVAVVAGAGHNLALKNDGTVAAWGFLSGAPALLDKVTAIAAGQDHALVVRTGKLTPIILKNPVDWQQTNGGMVSFGVNVASLAPVSYQWQSNTVNLSGATNATLTLSNVQVSATYRVLVANSAGFVQSSNAALQIIVAGPPVIQTVTPPPGVVWIKSFTSLAVSATAVGQELDPIYQCRYQWKSNGVPIPGQTLSFFFLSIGTDPATLAGDYSVTVTNAVGGTNVGPWRLRAVVTGSVVGWGAADSDLLNVPAGATNITALAASLTHSLLVREDGTTLAWGRNDYGETNVPPTLTNTVAVAGGINHSLALRSDGTVVAWGRNHVGQTNVPSGLTNVTSIAGAGNYSLALLRNGTVTNWGETYGNIPANLTNATAIAAGRNFSLALRSNGTVVAWGANDFGQTNLPSGLTNVVAIAAGGFHALALRENGTVLAWGSVSNAPADLTNALTIAAGWSHNAAIRNNGRVVSWGDNTYGQTNSTSGLSDVKLLAAGGDHTLVSIFSPLVQYPVDVTKDLLLIYNATSTNSIVVKDYYLAHRPMVSGANTMGINCTTNELIDIATFTNQILPAILDWLTNNPTKRPQYIILFPDLPTRVWETLTCTNYCRLMSVAFGLHTNFPGLKPFVTSINMGLHDLTNDCIAYINKLAAFGTNGQLFISASKGGYGNTNFVVDNVRHGSGYSPSYAPWGSYVFSATNGLSEAGVSPGEISYLAGNETRETNELGGWFYHDLYHITNAANVAGYISWGAHSSLGNEYARFGPIRVKWTGNSAWWIIETIESFNGHRATGQGNFTQWFSTDAFGGTGYENTPIGAVSHTDEPGLGGVNDSRLLFGLWAQGKIFAISGWNSRMTRFFQAVGDPFTTK
jgi:alpha-tubulin suppressor-like RCC1 family protein